MINEDFRGQRDADYKPLNQPAKECITVVMSQEFTEETQEDGENDVQYTRVLLDVSDAMDAEVDAYVQDRWPAEHCQHEYDCCGHWYQHRASWERSGKFALVTFSFYQNI